MILASSYPVRSRLHPTSTNSLGYRAPRVRHLCNQAHLVPHLRNQAHRKILRVNRGTFRFRKEGDSAYQLCVPDKVLVKFRSASPGTRTGSAPWSGENTRNPHPSSIETGNADNAHNHPEPAVPDAAPRVMMPCRRRSQPASSPTAIPTAPSPASPWKWCREKCPKSA